MCYSDCDVRPGWQTVRAFTAEVNDAERLKPNDVNALANVGFGFRGGAVPHADARLGFESSFRFTRVRLQMIGCGEQR